uniref:Uncharacterized protein n=1 Tax=Tetradesmus obliquus TaxID=3088 RepID=A0A383WFS8_TETOB|eukprot:jgi/Sobl393_1/19360/SZX76082.1
MASKAAAAQGLVIILRWSQLSVVPGRFLLGQTCLVLWTVWAWGQRSSAAAAAAATSSMHATATLPAADPFISLLLAALPLTAEQLPMAAVLLPAALYEGLLGVAAVVLISGRWVAWLLLWMLWLWCCSINCSSSRRLQDTAAHLGQVHGTQLAHSQQQQQQLAQKKLGCSSTSLSSRSCMGWLLAWLLHPVALAAAQLLLPVCMAVVAVWR